MRPHRGRHGHYHFSAWVLYCGDLLLYYTHFWANNAYWFIKYCHILLFLTLNNFNSYCLLCYPLPVPKVMASSLQMSGSSFSAGYWLICCSEATKKKIRVILLHTQIKFEFCYQYLHNICKVYGSPYIAWYKKANILIQFIILLANRLTTILTNATTLAE